MPYITARCVMDRLDDVLGVDGWKDSYTVLADGSVMCRLALRIGERWVVKADVGSQSEQPDEGDRRKAAFSDALKRTAVKFGIGRYLYRLPSQWCDYDPQKKQFSRQQALAANGVELQKRLHDYDARLAKQGMCQAGELVKHVVAAGVKAGYSADLTT